METSTKILCGICDAQHVTTYADFWCPECDDGLCTECNSHHSFSKASRHHDVISIENYRKLPTDILSIVHHCTEHEKKFHIFCPHHDQLCCHLCLSTGHTECTGMLSIEEIAKTSKSSGLLETLQKSLEDLKSNIDNVVKDRQSNLIKIKEEQQNILAGIQNLRKRINSHFDKLEQEIVEELNAAELDMKMKIEDLFKELREKSERIAVLQTNISDLENYASDFQTFVGSKKIEKEIESEETYIQSLTKDERLKQVSLKYSNNEEIENVFQSITSFGLISKESGSPCIEIKLEKNKQAQILTTSFIPKSVDNTVSAPMVDTEEMDPELARYLNRNYWQQKSEIKTTNVPTTTPSAPVVTTEQKATEGGKVVIEAYQNGENEDDEEQFLKALQSSLEIFVNRMRSNSQRGRSIATDSSVQSLFNVISNMHPQLMKYVGKQEDLRGNYEALQDKLAQLRDAREALDALREDHREKRRRELEEMERQRQIQMAHKLEIMRQKKHEYLEMQRQLALQRLQEQEREMQMRLEQQKHMTQIRQMQNYGYPQPGYGQMPMSGVPPQQTFSPVGSSDGSPVHQMQNMYGQQPMGHGQQPMGQSTPQMYNQPNTQPGYSQAGGQYQPQVTSQNGPQYQQGPYQQQPMSTQPSNLPGAYDGQAGYQTGGQYGQMPAATMSQGMPQQGGMPPSTASQGMPQTSMAQPQGMQPGMPQGGMPTSPIPPGMPQQGIPMNQGYQVPTSSNVDYNQAYNMQGMANALPQQQYSNQPQQYMGNQTGQYQQPPPQGQQQELPQGPPPGSNEAQLISFD